jgi:hypothetical protein
MGSGNRIDADFVEDEVALAIQSFLTVASFPFQRFTIELFSGRSERRLGADARLTSRIAGFLPFYMQFKRPSAYPDFSNAKIVKHRKSLNLESQPRALYFSLRERMPHHDDFQHNILYRLRQGLITQGQGDAAYVCPLFLDRIPYMSEMHRMGVYRRMSFWRDSPWDWEDLLVNDNGQAIEFSRIPILREHVSIPPHALVTDAKHSYSFSENGTDLCFHSPKEVPELATSLAEFLTNLSLRFLSGDGKVSQSNAGDVLAKLARDATPAFVEQISGDDAIGDWLAWGHFLRTEYRIEQFAFIRWKSDGV